MPSKLPPRKDKNRVPRQKRVIAPTHKDAERVAKVVARAGLGSRREIEDWIADGRVAVNGKVLESPAVTVTAEDRIEVDGAPLPEKERTRLFLYHKPRGVVTTNRDPEGRATLFEILPRGLPRLVSVGRLDLNSEGLILLTNDGGLARVLELPETGWLRRYRVRAKGEIDQAKLDTLLKGITVDGISYGPIEATLDRVQGANAWLTMSLREGKNREIRNVLAGLGMAVNRLIRVSYGPFQLGDVPEGEVEEVRTRILRDQIGAELIAASGADFDAPLIEREIEEAPRRPAPTPAEPVRGAKRGAGRPARSDDFAVEDAPARPRGRRPDPDRELESRGTVADRKGRTVKVERVVSPRAEEARPARSAGPKRGRPTGDGEERPARRGASAGYEGRPRREDGPARAPRRSEGREGHGEREERPARRAPSAGYEGRPRREDGPARAPRRSEGREGYGEREERPARRAPSAGYEGRPRREEGASRPPRRTERRDFGTDRDDASPKRRNPAGRFESREERPARSEGRPPRRPAGAREEREDFRRGGSDRTDKRGPARGAKPGAKPGFGDRPRRDDDAPRSRAPRAEGERPRSGGADRPTRAPRRPKDGEVGFFSGEEAPRGRAPGGRAGAPKGAGRSFAKDGPRSGPRSERPTGKPGGRPAGKSGPRPTGGKPGGSRPPRKRD